MAFSEKLVNKKVVDHLLIYLVLNFHGHRTNGLKIIAFKISVVRFACPLDRSERLNCLTWIATVSAYDDYKKVVDNFIRFLKSPRSYYFGCVKL